MTVIEEEYHRTRAQLRTEREQELQLNWKNGHGIVFGFDSRSDSVYG